MTERDGEPSVESAEARRRGAAYEQPRWHRAREREEATKIRYGAWHLASAACGDGQSGRGRRSVVWLWRVCGGSVPCPLCPRVPREARVCRVRAEHLNVTTRVRLCARRVRV